MAEQRARRRAASPAWPRLERRRAPQVLAQDVVNPAVIDVSLDDIGGLDNIKSTLVRARAAGPAPRRRARAAAGRVTGAARRAVQRGDRAAAAAAPVLHVAAAPGQGRAAVRAAGHREDHAGQGARPGPASPRPARLGAPRPAGGRRVPPGRHRRRGARAARRRWRGSPARASSTCGPARCRASGLATRRSWCRPRSRWRTRSSRASSSSVRPARAPPGPARTPRRGCEPAAARAGALLGRGLL